MKSPYKAKKVKKIEKSPMAGTKMMNYEYGRDRAKSIAISRALTNKK